MAPYLRGTRYVLLSSPDEIKYLLQDEFLTADAAPITTPRTCDPGPGTAAIRDVEEEIAIADGWLEFTPQAVSPVYAEQDIVYATPVITRAAGVALVNKFRCSTDGSFYPLALVTSATPTWNATHVEAAFHRAATALSLTATSGAAAGPIIATFVADSTVYNLALVLAAGGQKYYIKGGAFTNWTLLWRSTTGATASLYAAMAGYNAAFGASFIRDPQAVISISDTLLSFTGAMTWPTTNIAPTLTLLDAGTWAAGGTYLTNTPVAGVELLTNGNFTAWTGDNPDGWSHIAVEAAGYYVTENPAGKCKLISDGTNYGIWQDVLTPNKWFRINVDVDTVAAGGLAVICGTLGTTVTYTSTGSKSFTGQTGGNTRLYYKRNAGATDITFDNASAKPLPISTLITNVQLATTDVLAEMVIHAYTLGSQVGWVQSDHPFAFLANANAAAGQKVIVLKGLTKTVPDTDSITIKHPIAGGTTYTIASVGALSGGVQTLTLDVNLVEAVSEDDKVGVDWAAWNGFLTYFDGAGNIKIDEIKAGVYTNRLSAAVAFVADKRLIVRKIGTEVRCFFNAVLIGTTSLIDAAALVGLHGGLFSTLVANTITSACVHDTGSVTNAHSVLDRYSKD